MSDEKKIVENAEPVNATEAKKESKTKVLRQKGKGILIGLGAVVLGAVSFAIGAKTGEKRASIPFRNDTNSSIE